MRHLHVDDHVRLLHALPELMLDKGVAGVVRSEWFSPATYYEVEFRGAGASHATRALLAAEQLAIDDGAEGN